MVSSTDSVYAGQNMTTDKSRQSFRTSVFEREDNQCIVPWCDEDADDAHHIIERDLWSDGGYILQNGVGVCNHHHQYAEANVIPPQSFWMWIGIDEPVLPESVETWQVNKWGRELDSPPWEDLRDRIKYQSSRHLLPLYWNDSTTTASERMEHDDTGVESLEDFVGIPLVITQKMDGGNCMIVSDMDNPVRARNGSRPKDTMELLYDELYWRNEVHEKLPERLQVFGEWLLAKHSIHYGCECDEPCDDVGPGIADVVDPDDDCAYFQVFGVFDTLLNCWLSWPKVEQVATTLGFPTTPVMYCEDSDDGATFETEYEARQKLIEYAHKVIETGGEGIVVRSKFGFHYGQFEKRLGKYVRENHVTEDEEHWSKRTVKQNRL